MKAAAGPGAVYMAGGIDVVNRMKSGFPVTDLIHLGRVAGLDGIEEFDDGLRLGALVTHERMATSPLVLARLPAFGADLARCRQYPDPLQGHDRWQHHSWGPGL